MLEAGAKEVSEDIVFGAIRFGHEANQGIIALQEQVQQALGEAKEPVLGKELSPDSPTVSVRL